MRNVTEKVNVDELKATLGKFGELVYFDVNRSKVCRLFEKITSTVTNSEYRTVLSSSLPRLLATVLQLQPTHMFWAAKMSWWSLVVQRLLLMVEADTTITTVDP